MTNATYTTTLPVVGSPLTTGQIYTTNTPSVANWSVQNIPANQITNGNGKAIMTVPTGTNTLEVTGNVVINGVDLEERLNTIEKVLQIPERDVKLERKYPKLKKMYDEYIAALAKYRTFDALKGDTK